jgi:uncharacterized phage-associated protein
MKTYSRSDIEKIGNTIVYLAERIPDLSKTKLLKLLYLLEESYAIKHNLPFLGLEFEVWQAGPVARDIFIELSDEPNLLSNYITIQKQVDTTFVKALNAFNDDEFSDNEIDALIFVVEKFGSLTAKRLVDITHRKNSAWYKVAKSKGLIEAFEKGLTNSSDEKIDFTSFLDEKGRDIFIEQTAFKQLVSYINL